MHEFDALWKYECWYSFQEVYKVYNVPFHTVIYLQL